MLSLIEGSDPDRAKIPDPDPTIGAALRRDGAPFLRVPPVAG